MLSRRITTAVRLAPLRANRPVVRSSLAMLPTMMQTVRTYADKVIQVPQMAESISEGTLKQFSKSVGDYVELDEEIATIETDKVRGVTPALTLSMTRHSAWACRSPQVTHC